MRPFADRCEGCWELVDATFCEHSRWLCGECQHQCAACLDEMAAT